MNTISQVILAIAYVSALKDLFCFFAVMSGIFGAAAGLIYFLTAIDNELPIPEFRKSCLKALKLTTYVFIITCTLNLLMPSAQTLYLIAGSELGEQALNTETGKQVQTYLQLLITDSYNSLKETTK